MFMEAVKLQNVGKLVVAPLRKQFKDINLHDLGGQLEIAVV